MSSFIQSVILFLLTGGTVLFFECSPTGGTITEENTGKISGETVFTDYVRASRTAITLYRKDTSADSRQADIWKPADSLLSDNNGAFSFDSLEKGVYLVEARTINSLHAGCLVSIVVSGTDLKIPELTLRPLGTICGQVDSSLLTTGTGANVFIQELHKTVAVDNNGSFTIPDLPPYTYTLYFMKDNQIPNRADHSIAATVQPGKTTILDHFGSSVNTIEAEAPDAPEPLNAFSITYSQVILLWHASRGAQQYTLFRYNINTGTFDLLAVLEDTSFVDLSVVPEMSYSYVLQAGNRVGMSPKSSILSITTPRSSETLPYPKLSITVPGNNAVYLSSDIISGSASISGPENGPYTTIILMDDVPIDSSSGTGPFNWATGPLAKGFYSLTIVVTAANGTATVSAPLRLIVDDLVFGDVNLDGIVDYYDALDISRFYVGLEVNVFDDIAADLDGNGVVNIVDALIVAQYQNRSIDIFPRYSVPK